ncbi:MAG: hypothetical protein ACI82F_004409 [Planctomycetota bacterium]
MRQEAKRSADGEGDLKPSEKVALLEALGRGLEEALPGIEVLDRALVLDEGVQADLAAVDGSGRLLVVLLADTDADRATLAVLDLVAWVREHSSVLIRHLDCPALRADKSVRTLVVVTESVDSLCRRLVALDGSGVELFGLRTIQSSAGDRVYLSSIGAPGRSPLAPEEIGDAFIGALPEDLRELGRHAVDRITRLDDELVALAGDDSIAWRFRGESLVRIERAGDRLRATLGPEHKLWPLRSTEDVEELLEGALSRLVPLFSTVALGGQNDGADDGLGCGEEKRPDVMSQSMPSGGKPLLSDEEMRAFHD